VKRKGQKTIGQPSGGKITRRLHNNPSRAKEQGRHFQRLTGEGRGTRRNEAKAGNAKPRNRFREGKTGVRKPATVRALMISGTQKLKTQLSIVNDKRRGDFKEERGKENQECRESDKKT